MDTTFNSKTETVKSSYLDSKWSALDLVIILTLAMYVSSHFVPQHAVVGNCAQSSVASKSL